jgi:hypothetical protein
VDASTNAPLAGAAIRFFQSTGNGQLYGKNFSSSPSQILTTDANGAVSVGHNPFTSGSISPWHDNTDILVRVQDQQQRVRYVFMEASDFNLEFWRGHTSLGTYTMSVAFQAGAVVSAGNPVLGFESPAYWSTTAGALASVSSPITQGAAALQVSGIGYATLRSTAVSSRDVAVGSKLAFDMLLPSQENGSWYGQAQVYLNSPTRGVYDAFIGSVNLSGLPLETYQTLTLTLPAQTVTNLEAGAFDDLTVKIVLDLPSGSGRHLLDNFRFLP